MNLSTLNYLYNTEVIDGFIFVALIIFAIAIIVLIIVLFALIRENVRLENKNNDDKTDDLDQMVENFYDALNEKMKSDRYSSFQNTNLSISKSGDKFYIYYVKSGTCSNETESDK